MGKGKKKQTAWCIHLVGVVGDSILPYCWQQCGVLVSGTAGSEPVSRRSLLRPLCHVNFLMKCLSKYSDVRIGYRMNIESFPELSAVQLILLPIIMLQVLHFLKLICSVNSSHWNGFSVRKKKKLFHTIMFISI